MNRFATWKMTAAVMASVGLAGGVAVSMAGTPEAPPAAEPVAFSGEFVAAAAQDADDKFSIANLPPVVIKTVPTSGAEDVDPDTTELRATFSKDMIVENFSWVQVSKEHFPETTGKPKFEDDKRTCVLPVKLQPGKRYVLWLNQGRFSSFMDPKGNRAVPYMLVFRTADADE